MKMIKIVDPNTRHLDLFCGLFVVYDYIHDQPHRNQSRDVYDKWCESKVQ